MAAMQKELDALRGSQNSAIEKVREEMAAAQVRCFGLRLHGVEVRVGVSHTPGSLQRENTGLAGMPTRPARLLFPGGPPPGAPQGCRLSLTHSRCPGPQFHRHSFLVVDADFGPG